MSTDELRSQMPPMADLEWDRLSLLSHVVLADLGGAYHDSTERFNNTGSAIVNAAGLAVIPFLISPGQDWLIERVTFASDVVTTGVGTVRIDSIADPMAIVMVTAAPTLAVVEAQQPIYARAYQTVYVVVTGGTPAAVISTRIQYRIREGEPVKEN